MRGIFTLSQAFINSVRAVVDDHVAFHYHPDGWQHGCALYLRCPYTRLSVLAERRDVGLGHGVERTLDGLTIYLDRWQAAFCSERGELYRSSLSVR